MESPRSSKSSGLQSVFMGDFRQHSDHRYFLCNGAVHISSLMMAAAIASFLLGFINVISWHFTADPSVAAVMGGVTKAFVLVIGICLIVGGLMGGFAVSCSSAVLGGIFAVVNMVVCISASCTSLSFILWRWHHGSTNNLVWVTFTTGLTAVITVANAYLGGIHCNYSRRGQFQLLPVRYKPDELKVNLIVEESDA